LPNGESKEAECELERSRELGRLAMPLLEKRGRSTRAYALCLSLWGSLVGLRGKLGSGGPVLGPSNHTLRCTIVPSFIGADTIIP
jgi:hypothetical protein